MAVSKAQNERNVAYVSRTVVQRRCCGVQLSCFPSRRSCRVGRIGGDASTSTGIRRTPVSRVPVLSSNLRDRRNLLYLRRAPQGRSARISLWPARSFDSPNRATICYCTRTRRVTIGFNPARITRTANSTWPDGLEIPMAHVIVPASWSLPAGCVSWASTNVLDSATA